MNIAIREMQENEYFLLNEFLYQAIFQREEDSLLPRNVIEQEELQRYIKNFGSGKDDHCICAEDQDSSNIVGAVWVRNIDGYGSIDDYTPEFSISIDKDYRGLGIGTRLMKEMLDLLKKKGYEKASLSVQKDNYALNLYQNVGFSVAMEKEEDYIMVWNACQ